MRFSTLALLALASTTLANTATDACGVPEPRVYKLSSHWVRGATNNTRTFALLGATPEAGHRWTMLAPQTYDNAEIAPGSAYGPAVELTLVGETGARRVSATDHTFLRGTWDGEGAFDAVEVDAGKRGDFRIAIAGADDQARFHALDGRKETNDDAIWLSKQHVNAYNAYISVEAMRGTKLEVLAVSPRNGDPGQTIVRSGDLEVGRFTGRVLGGLTSRGFDYVLVDDGTRVRAQPIY